MQIKFFIAPLTLCMAFVLGFVAKKPIARSIATDPNHNTISFNTYDNIPCPSTAEAENFILTAHIEGVEATMPCDSSHSAKLLKLFKLATLLNINLPETWAGSAQEALVNPLTYISTSTPKLLISDTTSHAIASNLLGKEIYLGHSFFKLPPLKALEVLIHENRHSNTNAHGHTACLTGDLMKTPGACDTFFIKDETAGAYSFGVLFSLGHSLFSQNLNRDDREYLMSSALVTLSTRFNNILPTMASALDLLYVLDANGKVFQIHPFTFEKIPVDIATHTNETVVRIQYDPLYSGILAFTNQGRIYGIDHNNQPTDYYSNLIGQNYFAVDSTKIYTPLANYSYTYFVEHSGDIHFKDTTPASGEESLTTYRRNLPFKTKKFFGALSSKMIFLTDTGELHQAVSGMGPRGHSPQKLKGTDVETIEWIDATGGVTYDALFGVSAQGTLYQLRSSLFDSIETQESSFDTKEPIVKFQEGLTIKMALTISGELYAQSYQLQVTSPYRLSLPEIKDFALGRKVVPNSELATLPSTKTSSQKDCSLVNMYKDPWTSQPMGFTKSGMFAFIHNDGHCTKLNTLFNNSIELLSEMNIHTTSFFYQSHLSLKRTNQAPLKLIPYADFGTP